MINSEDCINYPSVGERYFTPCYALGVQGKPQEDHCILFHHNKICVITVAPSHPLITQRKAVSHIDFQITENINRLANKVTGKGKRGGQWLTKTSPLCKVKCDDGSQYTLYSCVNGKLVEVNENLITNPSLLINKPQSDGYIAIVLPNLGQSDPQKESLISHEKYKELISSSQ